MFCQANMQQLSLAPTRLSRKAIRISMLSFRSMLKRNRKLAEQHIPLSQHTITVPKLLEPPERTMISAQYKLRSPQKQTKVSAHGHRRQHFPLCSTVPALAPDSVCDHNFLIILELVEDAAHHPPQRGWHLHLG